MELQERIINGLYGMAVADGVGNPFEFKRNIDPQDVISYAETAHELQITDDTQMAAFLFEGIAEIVKTKDISNEFVRAEFTENMLDWLYTQRVSPYNSNDHKVCLLQFPSLYKMQAPGNTCLTSLNSIRFGKEVKNDSFGCGSTMRLLPLVALFDKFRYVDVMNAARISCDITHKNIMNIVGSDLYMETANKLINDIPLNDSFIDVTHVSQLGTGWTAVEAVQMAIWCYTKSDSFETLLSLSIAHDGDSDSVAAIAGSLWGLAGKEVPQKYIKKLDALDALKFVETLNTDIIFKQ